MGTLSIAAGKPDFAIGFFEKAVSAQPANFRFLNNLGNVLMQTGRTEEGLPYLEKALRLRPTSFELLCNIGRAYQKMRRGGARHRVPRAGHDRAAGRRRRPGGSC